MSDSLSVETLQLIQETAVKAASSADRLAIVDGSLLGQGKVLLVKPDGTYETIQRTSERCHVLGELMSVVAWAKYAAEDLGATPVLWVNAGQVQVVIDDLKKESPRPLIVYRFQQTTEYQLLQRLSRGEPQLYEQKPFIRMLRTEIWDCLDGSKRDGWVKIFRSMKSQEGATGKADIGVGRQSLGRDIAQAVTSEFGDIPEQITLSVRLFQDTALVARQNVVADIDVTPNTFKFSLQPLQSDMNEALENEVSDVVKFLRAELADMPIFRGTYQP